MYRMLIVGEEKGPALEALSDKDWSLDFASTPTEALNKVQSSKPDLVLIDVCLSLESEARLLTGLRAKNQEVPILVKGEEAEHWKEFWSWAATGFVDPDQDPKKLKEKIRKLLQGEDRKS